jgi:hypothetical protein
MGCRGDTAILSAASETQWDSDQEEACFAISTNGLNNPEPLLLPVASDSKAIYPLGHADESIILPSMSCRKDYCSTPSAFAPLEGNVKL